MTIRHRSPTMTADGTLTLALSAGRHQSITINTPTFLKQLTGCTIIASKLVLLGNAGLFDEVVVIDTNRSRVLDRSIGYHMQVLSNRWLVSVEWYPNHIYPPDYPTDVVLLRDLSTQDKERIFKPATTLKQLIESAGSPIFPSKTTDYSNIHENNDQVDRVYPETFAELSSMRLCFISSRGPDGEAQMQNLTIVPLITPGNNPEPIIQSLAPVYTALGRSAQEPLQFVGLQQNGPNAVKIMFPENRYRLASYVVEIKPVY